MDSSLGHMMTLPNRKGQGVLSRFKSPTQMRMPSPSAFKSHPKTQRAPSPTTRPGGGIAKTVRPASPTLYGGRSRSPAQTIPSSRPAGVATNSGNSSGRGGPTSRFPLSAASRPTVSNTRGNSNTSRPSNQSNNNKNNSTTMMTHHNSSTTNPPSITSVHENKSTNTMSTRPLGKYDSMQPTGGTNSERPSSPMANRGPLMMGRRPSSPLNFGNNNVDNGTFGRSRPRADSGGGRAPTHSPRPNSGSAMRNMFTAPFTNNSTNGSTSSSRPQSGGGGGSGSTRRAPSPIFNNSSKKYPISSREGGSNVDAIRPGSPSSSSSLLNNESKKKFNLPGNRASRENTFQQNI